MTGNQVRETLDNIINRSLLLSIKHYTIFAYCFTVRDTVLEASRLVTDFILFVYGSSCFFKYLFCVWQFMHFSLFWSPSLFFSFAVYFFISDPALGMPKNKKRKQRSKNDAAKRDNYMNCRIHKLQHLGLLDSPQDSNVCCLSIV